MTEPTYDLITRSTSGDSRALAELVDRIVSIDPETQSLGLSYVQDVKDNRFWNGLLALVAEGQWPGASVPVVSINSERHQRLSSKIRYLFIHDVNDGVSSVKEDTLISALQSSSSDMRSLGCELLGERRSPRSSSALMAALRDSDAKVRWHAAVALGQIADPNSAQALVECLSRQDPVLNHQAREALVAIGSRAIPSLIAALSETSDQVRWEAGKALCTINDPEIAPTLVGALEDNNAGVRWLAAEGLIKLRRHGLEALLHGLVHRRLSTWLAQGAHHALNELRNSNELEVVASSVLAALNGPAPAEEVPTAALSGLNALGSPHDG